MKRLRSITIAVALCTAACAEDDRPAGDAAAETDTTTAATDTAPGANEQRASATLADTAGRDVGTVTLTGATDGVTVDVRVNGLPPGEHGTHVHQVGSCEAVADTAFAAAGDHLNPTGAQHGLDSPQGPHMGDLPNLEVASDSSGTLNHRSELLRLSGSGAVLDSDGAAFIVHAEADDQVTDPSGESGDRIACGVLRAG